MSSGPRAPSRQRRRQPEKPRRARRLTLWWRLSLKPPAQRDETLQDPRCVLQIVKTHFARYTPEIVEKTTGCPKETFLKVAETILASSGADKTTSFAYAVAWTQHTYGVQIIGACALLQLLLGNIGRPGAGVMALRGHASIQGSTDVPTLYHSIQGYMAAPTALKRHDTLQDYLAAETLPTGYWANMPKFVVSYLKSIYGDAATKENQFGCGLAPEDPRRPLAYGDVRGDERRQGEGDVVRRAESGHVGQRQAGAVGATKARLAGGER